MTKMIELGEVIKETPYLKLLAKHFVILEGLGGQDRDNPFLLPLDPLDLANATIQEREELNRLLSRRDYSTMSTVAQGLQDEANKGPGNGVNGDVWWASLSGRLDAVVKDFREAKDEVAAKQRQLFRDKSRWSENYGVSMPSPLYRN